VNICKSSDVNIEKPKLFVMKHTKKRGHTCMIKQAGDRQMEEIKKSREKREILQKTQH